MYLNETLAIGRSWSKMRHWNGLNVRDIVIYHELEYIVESLYEKDGKNVCDIISKDEKREEIKAVSVFDCTKKRD